LEDVVAANLPEDPKDPAVEAMMEKLHKELMEKTLSLPASERRRITRKLLKNDIVLQRLAKVAVRDGYRNFLESIHVGTTPSSATGDGTDIKVVSPYGEIPWNSVSRISDEEMRKINKRAVSYLYNLLVTLLDGLQWPLLEALEERDPVPLWDGPNS
jgi:hypothetical protein